jgi:TolB-like protein
MAALYARENATPAPAARKTVFIYSFLPLEESGKYQYYSAIIPRTIAKTLARNENLEIEAGDETLATLAPSASKDETNQYHQKISSRGVDYVITGFCEIAENPRVMVNGANEMILKIKLQVFNAYDLRHENIEITSREIGVILKESIDSAASAIEEKLALFEKSNREAMKPSPFIAAHRAFKRFSVGIEVGQLFILDHWADLYNWSQYARPYFMINILDYLGMSLFYDYFSTDNSNKNQTTGSSLEIHTASLGIYYTYRFARYFDVMAAAAGGVSFTTIHFESSGTGPFGDPLGEKKSIDPSIDIAASMGFHLSSVIIRVGCGYRRYFYTGEHLHGIAVYGSLGYNF